MPGTIHILFGAALGVLLGDPSAVFVTSFFSHYLLDLLPHVDAETFILKYRKYTWTEFIGLIMDSIAVIVFLAISLWYFGRFNSIILGSIAAQLPDLLMPLEKYRAFEPFQRLHYMFHWNPRRAFQPSWFAIAIIMPVTVGIASLSILYFGT